MAAVGYGVLGAGIIFTCFSLCFYFLVFKNFKHIKIAIEIFDASADFAINHIRLVIAVFFYLLFLLVSFFIWIYVILYVMSLNDISNMKIGDTYFKTFKYSTVNILVLIFAVIMYAWFLLTINTLIKFWIVCSVATYYFNSDDEMEGQGEIKLAFIWSHINHLGTAAFGGGTLIFT